MAAHPVVNAHVALTVAGPDFQTTEGAQIRLDNHLALNYDSVINQHQFALKSAHLQQSHAARALAIHATSLPRRCRRLQRVGGGRSSGGEEMMRGHEGDDGHAHHLTCGQASSASG